MSDAAWDAIPALRTWLDQANGSDIHELTCRILKVTEEAGEAAGAWIGMTGQNPRKGVTHSRDDVAGELADVALTALVAIESLGLDARRVLNDRAEQVRARNAALPQAPPDRAAPRPGDRAGAVSRDGAGLAGSAGSADADGVSGVGAG